MIDGRILRFELSHVYFRYGEQIFGVSKFSFININEFEEVKYITFNKI